MNAISVRQPWAWLITQGAAVQPPKVAEFRSWHVGFRGWLLIHASKTRDPAGWAAARAVAVQHDVELPTPAEVATGGIVGAARTSAPVSAPSLITRAPSSSCCGTLASSAVHDDASSSPSRPVS